MALDTFGDELRRAREAAGLSQRALGDVLGVSGSAVGEWERGESQPTREKVPTIEQALGVEEGTLAALLGEDGRTLREDFADLQEQVRQQSQQIAEILQILRRRGAAGSR